MEFDLAGSGMRPGPGDSLGIVPHNDPHLVGLLLKRLGWEAGRAFRVHSNEEASTGARLLSHLRWPCSLRDALLYGCDITSVPKCAPLGNTGQRRVKPLLESLEACSGALRTCEGVDLGSS